MARYEKFADDIVEYLSLKLPDVPKDVAMDISAYLCNRTFCLVADELIDRDRRWEEAMKRGSRRGQD